MIGLSIITADLLRAGFVSVSVDWFPMLQQWRVAGVAADGKLVARRMVDREALVARTPWARDIAIMMIREARSVLDG